MSRSLIGGLINNGVKTERLLATDPDAEQRQNISSAIWYYHFGE